MNYVLSDIHGNERRFRSVMEQVRLQPEDTLYVLGDVIDRYPGGIRILRELMKMPNVKMLLGNHEYMMLRAVGQPYNADEAVSRSTKDRATDLWYYNGGWVTHNHLKHIRKSLREEIYAYLHSLPLNIDITVNGKAYKLVHGAPVEEFDPASRYTDTTMHAVWKRLEGSECFDRGYTLIFGHTPTKHYQDDSLLSVWYGDNCIAIDCGSGYPEDPYNGKQGRLACLRLEDGKVFYSE